MTEEAPAPAPAAFAWRLEPDGGWTLLLDGTEAGGVRALPVMRWGREASGWGVTVGGEPLRSRPRDLPAAMALAECAAMARAGRGDL